MANYSANNINAGTQQAVAATYKTLLSLTASSGTALRRFKIYDVLMGTNGTPADNFMEYDISRQTVAGTGTTTTSNALDPADTAALTVGLSNLTVEPTVTAASSVFYVGVNQRASYRWVAAPGSELVAPATNLAGFAFRTRSGGYNGTATVTEMFQEQ